MKIFNVAILLCLVAGSQATFLDSLKDTFTNLGQGLLEAGKTVGNSLLDQLKQTGMTLASTAVGELVDQLDQVAASGGSKRDLSAILHEAGPVMQLLEKNMGDHSEAQKVVFALAMKEFEHVVQNMTSADPASLLKTFKMIDDIVEGHAKLADYLLTDLKSSVTSLVPHKRSLVDSLGQVGNSLTDMFSPQIDSLKSIISSVGDALKQAAAGLFSSLTQSVAQLGSQLAPQLSTHVDAVKQSGTAIAGEGQNALDSLTSAVGDIFHQTMTNIQPHLSNIVEHGKQALGQAAGQIMTNMLTHSLTSALTGQSE